MCGARWEPRATRWGGRGKDLARAPFRSAATLFSHLRSTRAARPHNPALADSGPLAFTRRCERRLVLLFGSQTPVRTCILARTHDHAKRPDSVRNAKVEGSSPFVSSSVGLAERVVWCTCRRRAVRLASRRKRVGLLVSRLERPHTSTEPPKLRKSRHHREQSGERGNLASSAGRSGLQTRSARKRAGRL